MAMQKFSPIDYLKIDVANNFDGDLDKRDWDQRIDWFNQNEGMLTSILTGNDKVLKTAEEPALVYAGMKAFKAAEAGEASGYPVSLDACSSGLQLFSVLVGCEESAKLCGIVDIGHRADAYSLIYQAMVKELNESSKISRGDCKDAIMTAFFGSTAKPKQIFGEGKLLDTFHSTMELKAPGAWEANKQIKELWKPFALSHDWVLPDNYHVHIDVMDMEEQAIQFLNRPYVVQHKVNRGTKEGRSLQANSIHSVDGMVVREMLRRCGFSREAIVRIINGLNSNSKSTRRACDKLVMKLWAHYEKTGFLSTRILDNLDHDNMGHVDPVRIVQMIKTLPNKPFQVLSVHDCFRCLPNYANDMRMQYNQILSEIAASEMMTSIATQIAGQQVTINKMKDLSSQVLEANYALS
jgi:hypothetical protein